MNTRRLLYKDNSSQISENRSPSSGTIHGYLRQEARVYETDDGADPALLTPCWIAKVRLQLIELLKVCLQFLDLEESCHLDADSVRQLRCGTVAIVALTRSMYNGNCAIAKKLTGRQVTPYTGIAAYLSSSLSTKKCPAQKHTNMAAMDTNNDVKPIKTLFGRSFLKSLGWYLEVSIARNMTTEVTEKQRATRDEIANTLNSGRFLRTGEPLSSLFPPGTAADVAKATVAMSAATTEQDSEVLASHSPPLLTSSWCEIVNISFEVRPSELWRGKKLPGMEYLTYYKMQIN
ncbi:unnamed protein product [Dovyalis caffra]|uniref:Uncharacterized protein n=1 Tax=Dovyalis caffra TaxID=77055 RepID=A0AAV1S6P1_9ROSI|nr:unnamed protein product [Dovyalis caffra]